MDANLVVSIAIGIALVLIALGVLLAFRSDSGARTDFNLFRLFRLNSQKTGRRVRQSGNVAGGDIRAESRGAATTEQSDNKAKGDIDLTAE